MNLNLYLLRNGEEFKLLLKIKALLSFQRGSKEAHESERGVSYTKQAIELPVTVEESKKGKR